MGAGAPAAGRGAGSPRRLLLAGVHGAARHARPDRLGDSRCLVCCAPGMVFGARGAPPPDDLPARREAGAGGRHDFGILAARNRGAPRRRRLARPRDSAGHRPRPSVPATRNGRRPLVLYVGSIFNRRRLPDLIRAFSVVARAHPDAALDIVGDDRTFPPENPGDAIARAGLDGRGALAQVRAGRRAGPDVWAARAFAFLSEYEGLGLTPLEALAAGVPAVLLDTPVARESCGDAALYSARGDVAGVAERPGAVAVSTSACARGCSMLRPGRWRSTRGRGRRATRSRCSNGLAVSFRVTCLLPLPDPAEKAEVAVFTRVCPSCGRRVPQTVAALARVGRCRGRRRNRVRRLVAPDRSTDCSTDRRHHTKQRRQCRHQLRRSHSSPSRNRRPATRMRSILRPRMPADATPADHAIPPATTPAPTIAPEAPGFEHVVARVMPAIVLVEAPGGRGSGFFVAPGHAAHERARRRPQQLGDGSPRRQARRCPRASSRPRRRSTSPS